jgi:ribosomal protein L24E
MIRNVVVVCLVLAAVVMAASSHSVNLARKCYLGANELQPGEYKMQVTDGKVVLTRGKASAEAQAKIETAPKKYELTSVQYTDEQGKARIAEIQIGGTATRLIFN